MSLRGTRAVNFLIVFFLLGLTHCGGCASGAETQASLPIGESFLISGSVQAPGSGGSASLSPAASRALAAGGRDSVRFVLTNETAAAGAVCELIDSDGTVLETATADANGDYAFQGIDGDLLNDAGNSAYTTFYVRCTVIREDGTEFVEMRTHSAADTAVIASGEDSFTDLDVDPLTTAVTLFNYQGTNINPLSASEDEFPDDGSIGIPFADALNFALFEPIYAAYATDGENDSSPEVEDLDGQTMDEAVLTIIVATYVAIDNEVGDDAGLDVIDDLFNLDPDGDNADFVSGAIASEDGFESLSETDIEGSLNSLRGFKSVARDTWAANDEFMALVAGDSGLLKFFIGSSVFGSTLSEFQVLNFNSGILQAQLGLIGGLDLATLLAGNDAAVLYQSFGHILDPEIIAALLSDPDAVTGLQALVELLFSGEIDVNLIKVLSACLGTLSSEGTFWDQFVSGADVNGELLGNFAEFFGMGVESGAFADFFDNTATFGWDDFFAGIDLTINWGGVDPDAFEAQHGSLFSDTRLTITSGSCATSDPDVHFCGTYNARASTEYPDGCWCDDHCAAFGDCCGDKEDVCGENYVGNYTEEFESGDDGGDGTEDPNEEPSGHAPSAESVSFYSAESSELEFDLLSVIDDEDGDSVECYTGDASFSTVSHGTLEFNDATCIGTYMPDSGFVGIETFSYQSFDGSLYSAEATVTIHVVPQVYFTHSTSSGSEGDGSIAIEVSLSSLSGYDVKVNFTLNSNGTATAGSSHDYTIDTSATSAVTYDSGTDTYELTIPSGSTTRYVTVEPVQDSDIESDKTIIVDLQSSDDNSGIVGSPMSHTLTMTDDDDDDGDGVADVSDNCSAISNAAQADFDSDGVGDACDDYDGDGTSDADDSCKLFNPNTGCATPPYDNDNDGYTQFAGGIGGTDANDSDPNVH